MCVHRNTPGYGKSVEGGGEWKLQKRQEEVEMTGRCGESPVAKRQRGVKLKCHIKTDEQILHSPMTHLWQLHMEN